MTPIADVAVLTLAKGREAHLRQLLAGLAAGDSWPRRLVLRDMNPAPVTLPPMPFPIIHQHAPAAGLPLAAARNAAAAAAGEASVLVFLDVDCIPAPGLVRVMAALATAQDALICCEIGYLPPDTPAPLRAERALPHPHRPFPRGTLPEPNTGLFWSLAFAIRAASFARLGGFDPAYDGYGAEDTDLAFRAAAAGIPLLLTSETHAFHQHHPWHDPPLQHFADILANATRFHARHGFWPMEGWLAEFTRLGLIAWTPDAPAITPLRPPNPAEIARSACPPGRVV